MKLGRKKKAEGEEGKGGGRSNLLPAIVLAAGLAAGGFFFGGRGGGAPAAEAASEEHSHAEETEPEELGPVVTLEPITLNLADGHFLKIGLALQTAKQEGGGGGGHGGGGDPIPEGDTAKALDAAIELFGRHTMAELSDHAIRGQAKTALRERLAETYHGVVTDVYFTEFVMQ